MALPVRIAASDDDHVLAAWHNVVITRWMGRVRIDALEAAAVLGRELAERHDRRVVSVNLIENGLNIAPADVRRRAAELIAAANSYMVFHASVIHGEGFWSGAARTALAGIVLLSRDQTPHKVFGTTLAAAPEILHYVDAQGLTADGVVRALETVRGVSERRPGRV